MRIIDRYMLGQFVQVFFICFCSLTGLYIVFDGFANLDEFLIQAEAQGNFLLLMGEYYAYRSISFFDKISGMLALISAMFTVTWIQRHNELTALMAAGISRGRVVLPILIAAALISLLAAANRETMLPSIRHELSRDARNLDGEKNEAFRPRYDNETVILFRGRTTVAKEQQLTKPNFLLPRGLDTYGNELVAENAYWRPADPDKNQPAGYLLDQVTLPEDLAQKPALELGGEPIIITPAARPDLVAPHQCFVVSDVSFEQLTGGESWRQYSSTLTLIDGLKNRSLDFGADVRVAIHGRFVQPVLDFTLLFLGLPLVLRSDNRNMFMAMGLCLGLVSVFSLILIASQYLGRVSLVDPALGAWLPVIIFVPIAVAFADSYKK